MSPRQSAFVLIHGGNNSARVWDRLRPLLAGPSLAVDIPGRGARPADLGTLTLDDMAVSVRDDIEAWAAEGDVIVVAHSSAALFVPRLVAMQARRIDHIVLTPGSVPPEGGCGIDTLRPHQAVRLREWLGLLDSEGLPRVSNAGIADREILRRSYGGRPLTDDELDFVQSVLVPDSLNIYLDPVSWRGVRGIPITWVRTTEDRVQPVGLQDRSIVGLAAVAQVDVIDLDSGHMPAVTHTDELAAILNGLLPR